MKDLAGATLNESDYARLVALCEHGVALPSSFEEWSRLLVRAAEEAGAIGLPAHAIPVDVEEFEQWTKTVGIKPCLEALRAFLIVKRYGEASRLPGA